MVMLPMAEDEYEMVRLPYSYAHKKITLNGFSGFYPPAQAVLAADLTFNFPNGDTVDRLVKLKTDWVVVEKNKLKVGGALKAEYEDGDYVVYKLSND